MKRAFLRIGTILTLFPCCSFALAQLLPSQAKGSARAQVVMLNPAGGYAAGIIVGYDARLVYIATAAHITDLSANPPPNVQVKFEGLSQFPRPGKFWPQFEKPGAGDLAVVTIDRDDGINKFLNDLDFDLLSPVPLGPTDSPVTSIGFYGGAEWSSGAKETLLPPDQGYIRFQSDVNEGQSGGGLFNEAWELIGMPVDVGPNAVYARTIESILEDIRKWNIPVLLKVRPLKERARGADEIARLNAAVVKSQELAAKAEVQWTSSVQLASLLAVQASRTAQTDQAMVQLGRIWDHTFERTLYANDTLRAVAFSPDGTQLATGGLDGKLILWDPATGRQLRTINSGGGWVSSVAFSPDGKTVAAGSDMKVLIFDSQTGVLLATLLGHTDAVYSVAFSPDGKQLASGGGDHKVIVWDAKEAKLLRVLSGHTDVVYCVAFSPSGKLLASGSEDKSIILWNTADGSRIGTMTDQKDVVFCVAFSPDSSLLAAGYGTVYTGLGVSLLSQDKNVVIWDVLAQKRQLTLTGHTNAIAGVTFSPDGKLLVSGSSDKSLIVWDVKDGSRVQILTGHRKPIEGVAFAPSGEVIASVGDDHEVMLWDGPNGINHRTLSGHTGSVNSVAFSPDGAELASGGKNHELILWDVKKGVQLKSLRGHTASVNSVSFSADGKLLASGGGDKRIILWDARTGALLKTLDAPHNVYTVAFSPDSKQLASGGFDNNVTLWDIESGSLVRTLKLDPEDVLCVAYSPDGKLLASGSRIGHLVLWDTNNGNQVQSFDEAAGKTYRTPGVAFSSDGKQLVAAVASRGGDLDRWDTERFNHLLPLQSMTLLQRFKRSGIVNSVAISPDNRYITSGYDLWDAQDATRISTLENRTDIQTIAFSPDSKLLAMDGEVNNIVLWELDVESWQARACRMAGRNLTQAEWQQFVGDEPYEKTCPDPANF